MFESVCVCLCMIVIVHVRGNLLHIHGCVCVFIHERMPYHCPLTALTFGAVKSRYGCFQNTLNQSLSATAVCSVPLMPQASMDADRTAYNDPDHPLCPCPSLPLSLMAGHPPHTEPSSPAAEEEEEEEV